MSLSTYKLSDFLGGVNLVDEDEEVAVNELAYIPTLESQNVLPISSGKGLASRDGNDPITTTGTALPNTNTDDVANRITNMAIAKQFSGAIVAWSSWGGAMGVFIPFGGANAEAVAASVAGGSEWDFEYTTDVSGIDEYFWCYPTPGSAPMIGPRKMDAGGVDSAWAGVPAAATDGVIRIWKNRMIITHGTRLYFSAIGNPESFPANNFVDIKSVDDDGDIIMGLEPIGENLLVFKRNSVWSIYDSTNFTNRRLFPVGVVSWRAITSLEDRVFWVSRNGVYSTNGEDILLESHKLEPIFTTDTHALGLEVPHGLISTPGLLTFLGSASDGRLFLGTVDYGSYMWVGYPKYRNKDDEIPWYLLKNSSGDRLSSAKPQELIIGTARGVLGITKSPSTNLQYFHTLMVPNQTTDDTPTTSHTIVARAMLGWHLGTEDDEKYERLRRIIMLMRGSLTVDVYADYDSDTSQFTEVVTVPSGVDSKRVNVNKKARTHRLGLSGSDFEITELMLKYRGNKEDD